MTFSARFEGDNGLSGARIWPVGSALPCILEPFGQMPVDEALGSEGDLPVLDARFQNIANLNTHLFADMLRNHNLKLVFDGDDIDGSLSLSLKVEQYN